MKMRYILIFLLGTVIACLVLKINYEIKTQITHEDPESILATKPLDIPKKEIEGNAMVFSSVNDDNPAITPGGSDQDNQGIALGANLEEIHMMERVVAAEARGCDLEGQMAVAQVIINRSELWEMSIMEVVTQPGQFAQPYKGEISDLTREAVQRVLEGERIFIEPVTHFAESSISPYWAREKVKRGVRGGHTFYY